MATEDATLWTDKQVNLYLIVIINILIIILMSGMAVFLSGWRPHRGKAQMACN